MERFPWDDLLSAIVPGLDTPIAHWLVLIVLLLSAIGWLLSGKNVRLRRISALIYGGAAGLGLAQLLFGVLAA